MGKKNNADNKTPELHKLKKKAASRDHVGAG